MSEQPQTIDNILAGYFGNQAKNNQILLNIIDTIVRQGRMSEANYQNALKELEKFKPKTNKKDR